MKDFKPEIVWRDIESITPYVNNSKKHPVEQIDKIAGSISEFGWDQAIVVDGDGVIIKGHGRREAALRLGIKQVPVTVRTDLTPAQVKAARIADNRVAESEWDIDTLKLEVLDLQQQDFKLELMGFDADELADLLAPAGTEGKTDPDDVPENVETRCKPGQLWRLGRHRLLCGDSTKREDVERLMGGQSADLWLTDPPYGVAYESSGRRGKKNQHTAIKNDAHPLEAMGEFWADVAGNAFAACSGEASYYWFACQGGDQMMMMMMMSISRANWKVRHELIWVKDQMVFGRCDYHYKHEPILFGWKKDGSHNWYSDRKQTSVLEFARPKKSDEHPTMKPVELVEYLVANSSKPTNSVLDTFLGSGSTLIACEKSGRRCFGMEIDPHYCDVILKRWEDFTGQVAVLDG